MDKVTVVIKSQENGPYLHEDVEVLAVTRGKPSGECLERLMYDYGLDIDELDWSTWEIE